MNLLLDTHAVNWLLAADTRLSARAREAIRDDGNDVFVSAASAWEFAIKCALGKLHAPHDLLEALPLCRFRPLHIRLEHAGRAP